MISVHSAAKYQANKTSNEQTKQHTLCKRIKYKAASSLCIQYHGLRAWKIITLQGYSMSQTKEKEYQESETPNHHCCVQHQGLR